MAVATAAGVTLAPPESRPLDRRSISLLVFAHMFNDMNQSVVPALLPFLIAQRHLSYAAAGGIVLTLTIASSVVQPVFGYVTDKRSIPWLVPGGMLLGMLGTVMLGLAPTYELLLLASLVSGIGVAAFHPEAARYANWVSGSQRSTGMGFFGLGGNLGFALGPILVTPAILLFGLHGTALVVIPGAIYALYLGLVAMRRFASFKPREKKFKSRSERGDRWGAFGVLTLTLILRSTVFFGIITFTPLFFIAVLGATKAQANAALAMTLVAAALGTVTGGRLGDSFDRRYVTMVSIACAAIFATAIGLAAAAHVPIAVICVLFVLLAFTLQWSTSVTVVLGQEYLPTRIGTASGVTIGLAISIGGFGAPLLGHLADLHGLIAVMYAIGAIALSSFIAALFLPPVHRKRPVVAAPA